MKKRPFSLEKRSASSVGTLGEGEITTPVKYCPEERRRKHLARFGEISLISDQEDLSALVSGRLAYISQPARHSLESKIKW